MKSVFYILLILCCAAVLRLYGVNWDQDQHLHPDERFLTMVTTAAKVPAKFSDYLDPAVSTLNPYNIDFGFYVYGTLPITLNKLAVHGSRYDNYRDITLAGRYMSAMFDLGTLLLVIAMAQLLVRAYGLDRRLPYISGFLYAVAVLPIQNAHFYTVDAALAFFLTLSAVLALRARFSKPALFVSLSGIAFGFALACKISAIYAAPLIIGLAITGAFESVLKTPKNERRLAILWWLLSACLFAILSYGALRIGDPRMFATSHIFDFTINEKFLANIAQLKSFSEPSIGFPPSVQWLSKQPIIFPLRNIAFFGLGIVYFAISIVGLFRMGFTKKPILLMILVWLFGFFIYQGSRFVTSMRYFYPMYPYLALAAGIGFIYIVTKVKKSFRKAAATLLLLGILIWPLSFMAIYTRPHSRVAASAWILDNIPENSHIATEYWDDWLPLTLPDKPILIYKGISMPVFGGDTPEKWLEMEKNINEAEYYILTSNRGYDSIMPIPKYYPKMSQYYKDLFAGKTQFEKVAEFTSYPTLNIGFTKLQFDDQWSEEAFTVYDHPKVTIFKKRAQ
jgi:hypothetical protein